MNICEYWYLYSTLSYIYTAYSKHFEIDFSFYNEHNDVIEQVVWKNIT